MSGSIFTPRNENKPPAGWGKDPSVSRLTRWGLVATVLLVVILVISGMLVRSSGSAAACPDWPTCLGHFGLPEGLSAQIHFGHRILAGATWLLVLGMSVLSELRGAKRVTRTALWLTLGGLSANGLIGAWQVVSGGAAWLSPLHTAAALLTIASSGYALLENLLNRVSPGCKRPKSAFQARGWLIAGLLFVLAISGSVSATLNAGAACPGWPLCAGGVPSNGMAWLALTHRGLTLLALLAVSWQFWRAWRSQRGQIVVLPAATAVFLFMLAQVWLGGLKVSRGYPADLSALHAISAVGLWAAQLAVVYGSWFAHASPSQQAVAGQASGGWQRLRDFYVLSKPGIVILMLVTTFSGMVVAAKGLPEAGRIFWTLLGGALAAGGSSALNQYIDRHTDHAMKRTRKRPLPSGRLQPAEAIAYGLGACLTAFYVLAAMVNLLSAGLALVGMLYYVLLYSLWLKRLNEHNVVIGGGAGSIPPVVGWTAVTGSLGIPALFLFMVIFLWSPAHFWALAITRKEEYAAADVPMLPVVRGDEETRRQVFLYSAGLVGVTLLMPILGMAGSVFLAAALMLGGWLLYAAGRMWRERSLPSAWGMFRFSSLYMLLIFMALVADVLV